MSEEDRRSTPYGYTFDDPIRYTDPDGMFGEDSNNDCCRTAKIILGTGLTAAGIEVAVAAPTVVGEVVAVPAATATVVVTLVASGTALIYDAFFGSHKSTPIEPSPTLQSTPDKTKSPPNPDGNQGKPDHRQGVDNAEKKAQQEAKPGEDVLREKQLQGHDSKRKPDVQILDENGKARKVFEVERNPTYKRNKVREAEYDKLRLKHETIPLLPRPFNLLQK